MTQEALAQAVMLDQTSHDQFKPDYDTQAVLVEEMQRMAKIIAELDAKRTWVGLTDKEAMQICVDCGCLSEDWLTLLDAIEAKLKQKNGFAEEKNT